MPTPPRQPWPAPPPPKPNGMPAASWLILAFVLVVPLLVVGVFVLVWLTDDGSVVQVEAELAAVVEAMESYRAVHGRYAEVALDRDRQVRGSSGKVRIVVYVRDEGRGYCLEGFHADHHRPVASYESSRGSLGERAC
jgi:hypothetical protein